MYSDQSNSPKCRYRSSNTKEASVSAMLECENREPARMLMLVEAESYRRKRFAVSNLLRAQLPRELAEDIAYAAVAALRADASSRGGGACAVRLWHRLLDEVGGTTTSDVVDRGLRLTLLDHLLVELEHRDLRGRRSEHVAGTTSTTWHGALEGPGKAHTRCRSRGTGTR